jgi:hypothetical protein
MSNASLKEQLQAIVSQTTIQSTKSSAEAKAPAKAKPPVATKPHTHKRFPQKSQSLSKNAPRSAPKPKWLEQALYGVELLKAYFPQCFASGSNVKPLKKGIKQDLVKFLSTLDTIVTEDKACMVKSLTYYVNTAAYHKGVVEGASRIDLQGNVAGVVTVEEATYSVDRQKAKQQAKVTSPASIKPTTQEVTAE